MWLKFSVWHLVRTANFVNISNMFGIGFLTICTALLMVTTGLLNKHWPAGPPAFLNHRASSDQWHTIVTGQYGPQTFYSDHKLSYITGDLYLIQIPTAPVDLKIGTMGAALSYHSTRRMIQLRLPSYLIILHLDWLVKHEVLVEAYQM